MQCSYSFGFYSIIKYYITFLYYKFIGYPLAARICTVVVTLSVLIIIGLLLYNIIRIAHQKKKAYVLSELRNKYEEDIKTVSYTKEPLSQEEIMEAIDIPSKKMWAWETRLLLDVFVDIINNAEAGFNIDNFKLVQKCFRFQDFFEKEILKRNGKKRIKAFRAADTIEAYIKESIVSRFLFTSDKQLRMLARMYMVKYGTTYPFDMLNENKDSSYTTESQALLHDVLIYRHDHERTMPNFIHLLSDDNTSADIKQFVVNEIGLLDLKSYGFYLSEYLPKCREEGLQIAIIRTLGALRYWENKVEPYLVEIYQTVSLNVRRQIIKTLGIFNSGNPNVLSFFEKEYAAINNHVMRESLLSVIYNYGPAGRAVFQDLEAKSPEDLKIFFEHVKSPLIDSRKYA